MTDRIVSKEFTDFAFRALQTLTNERMRDIRDAVINLNDKLVAAAAVGLYVKYFEMKREPAKDYWPTQNVTILVVEDAKVFYGVEPYGEDT